MTANWIELVGAVNVRDVGGVAARGGRVRRRRLIRSDNLQDLTEVDVRSLVDEFDVRAVVDLRSTAEVVSEGPSPLLAQDSVMIHHLSLVPEAGVRTDAAVLARNEQGSLILPWHRADGEVNPRARDVYLGYLTHRPDSVLGALRQIAATEGATIVHCAAGKDRTGVVVALALAEVGVAHDDIIADYAHSGERIELIFQRLLRSPTYEADMRKSTFTNHTVAPETMSRYLESVAAKYGSPSAALRAFGWTDDDHRALSAALVEPVGLPSAVSERSAG